MFFCMDLFIFNESFIQIFDFFYRNMHLFQGMNKYDLEHIFKVWWKLDFR